MACYLGAFARSRRDGQRFVELVASQPLPGARRSPRRDVGCILDGESSPVTSTWLAGRDEGSTARGMGFFRAVEGHENAVGIQLDGPLESHQATVELARVHEPLAPYRLRSTDCASTLPQQLVAPGTRRTS